MRETGEGDEEDANGREEVADGVTERVRRDSELDEREQRLLGCTVDPRKSIPLFFYLDCFPTFRILSQRHQVAPSHLSHAIDSIWSVVSLPLLRLQPLRYGALEGRQLAGYLLFGSPGTGKHWLRGR